MGSLASRSQFARHDMAYYAVKQLARAMGKPSELHMTAAKHNCPYLKGLPYLGTTYKAGRFQLLLDFLDVN